MPTSNSIGTQLINSLNQRANKLHIASDYVAEAIDEQKNKNVTGGRGFGNDRFDTNYEKSYIPVRKKAGFQTQFTDLQMGRKRIRQTTVNTNKAKNQSIISFYGEGRSQGVTFGMIANFHHEGIRYRNGNFKMRSIFPKTLSSIPVFIHDLARRRGWEVLRGEK